MRGNPGSALPITAVQVSMSALLCMIWRSRRMGWKRWFVYVCTTQHVFRTSLDDSRMGCGLDRSHYNRNGSELFKILSWERFLLPKPLCNSSYGTAVFLTALLLAELWVNDYIGGVLIVGACFATALKPSDFEDSSKGIKTKYRLERYVIATCTSRQLIMNNVCIGIDCLLVP